MIDRVLAKVFGTQHERDIKKLLPRVQAVNALEPAIKAVKKAGGHAQGTVCYTISPVHTTAMFAKQAKQLEQVARHPIMRSEDLGSARIASRSRAALTASSPRRTWHPTAKPSPASTPSTRK